MKHDGWQIGKGDQRTTPNHAWKKKTNHFKNQWKKEMLELYNLCSFWILFIIFVDVL